MSTISPIRIDGLKEFNRDLKKLDRDLPKALRVALNDGADLVVSTARPKFPKRRGRARRSVKAKSTRTKVRVSVGGKSAPHAPWLDFGGRVGRNGSITRRWTGKEGRYVYPTYRRLRDSGQFAEVLSESLIGVARDAGIEVT